MNLLIQFSAKTAAAAARKSRSRRAQSAASSCAMGASGARFVSIARTAQLWRVMVHARRFLSPRNWPQRMLACNGPLRGNKRQD